MCVPIIITQNAGTFTKWKTRGKRALCGNSLYKSYMIMLPFCVKKLIRYFDVHCNEIN